MNFYARILLMMYLTNYYATKFIESLSRSNPVAKATLRVKKKFS